jgi:hypothetical protein
MTVHKFRAGQSITILPRAGGTPSRGKFTIVRLLPQERGINQYRIRSTIDGHERVVVESEIG